MGVRRLASILALWSFGCASDPARIVVSVVEPATASPQYFHGNCSAGFALGVNLRLQETQQVAVTLSHLSYRLSERETGAFIAEETLDARTLQDRYGEGAIAVMPGGTRLFRIGATLSEPPRGRLRIVGDFEGVDEHGEEVHASFDLEAAILVNNPEPPVAGAC